MWEYSKEVMDHFLNPRNVGEIPDADVVAEVGNITCGDALKLYLKIEDDRITDARFKTFGCASAIASSSVLTEMIKGKTLQEAERITEDDIARELQGLPEAKMHCSVMGRQALEKALAIHRGQILPEELGGQVVCHCFGVTEKTIERAVRDHGLATVDEVTHYTKAGGACGRCHSDIESVIQRVRAEAEGKARKAPEDTRPKAPGTMTNIQRMKKIMEVIDSEIRPMLKQDGGDLELVDVDGRNVLVSFRGLCVGCPSSSATLKEVVEKRLKDLVDPWIEVQEVR